MQKPVNRVFKQTIPEKNIQQEKHARTDSSSPEEPDRLILDKEHKTDDNAKHYGR